MKVVDVCGFYAPRGGGVRTYVERKLAAAASLDADVVIVAPGAYTGDEVRGPRARVRWLKSPRFPLDRAYRYFADRAALFAVLDQEAPDVVEVSSPWRSAAMVADWPGRALRALIAHADPLAAYPYRWFGGIADRGTIDRGFAWYWRHLLRLDARYDAVVAPGRSLADRLAEGGLTRVIVNPLGVEDGLFSPGRADPDLRARLLARCGLPRDATLLLGIGRHSPEKRWGLVADAATAAGLEAPVGLVIVGDGHARARVRRAVGRNPHIQLLAPVVDRAALATLLASADALIHGCEAETFCFVAAEAAASGLPVIAPDRGGDPRDARASPCQTGHPPADDGRPFPGAVRRLSSSAARAPTAPRHRVMDAFGNARFRRVAADGTATDLTRPLAAETPVAIELNGVGYAVLMATPADLPDLAAGFLLAERLIVAAPDIVDIEPIARDDGVLLRITLVPERLGAVVERVRHRVSESSCGLCGIESLEQALRPLPRLPGAPPVPDAAIFAALATLGGRQPLNRLTGAVHAAAACAIDGTVRIVREDVGRHNALDKLVGAMLRGGEGWDGGFALVTSRCSYELVEKAVLSGCPLLVTISAPTALAVARAREAGLALRVLARADAMLALDPA